MLNSLVIKNFRMLEDFKVEKLGRVNLIVGKNNSGKSTVLEALRIYAGANLPLLKSIADSHDEIFEQQTASRFSYKDLFTDRKLPDYSADSIDDYYYSDTEEEEIYIGDTEKEGVYIWPTCDINFISRSDYGQMMHEKSPHLEYYDDLDLQTPRMAYGFIPTKFIEIEELESEWNAINLTDDEDKVIEALQLIDKNVKRLAFDGNKEKRWVKVKLSDLEKPVPLKSLGDGMLRILQIAIKLVSAQGGFLLIDEFENGLHYSVQEKVWGLLFEMAEKLDVQIFATTHSWDCIESFATVALQQKPENEGLIFRMGKSVRKSNEGQVIATIFSGEELKYITQSNMEIR